MRVNFNNCRLQACRAYNRLCDKLNEATDSKGVLDLDADDIQKEMDDLRMFLVGIACTYEEGNPDFADLSGQINLSVFNDETQQP